MAVERVLADPEERIFIYSWSESLLMNKERSKNSYENLLRRLGITKICSIVGGVGKAEKNALFYNLDDQLTDCQAFLCNSAVTVAANPNVHFGTIIAHTHKDGCTITDGFQGLQRIGRGQPRGNGEVVWVASRLNVGTRSQNPNFL